MVKKHARHVKVVINSFYLNIIRVITNSNGLVLFKDMIYVHLEDHRNSSLQKFG